MIVGHGTKTKKRNRHMKNKIKFMTILAFATLSLSLTACETLEGAGRDIEKGGEAIQDAVR